MMQHLGGNRQNFIYRWYNHSYKTPTEYVTDQNVHPDHWIQDEHVKNKNFPPYQQ